MSLLDRLERKLGRYAVPNLTLVLVFGQSLCWFLANAKPEFADDIVFVPNLVLQGEVWRLLTFLFYPPSSNALFTFFILYLFYFMGTALEGYWGVFRYNVYLLIAYLATIAASFIVRDQPGTNVFIGASVYLAFAFLYPEFIIRLFFIIPIRIKWLAWATWVGYLIMFILGDWAIRFSVLASVANFLLFFGARIYKRVRYGSWRLGQKAKKVIEGDKPFHVCAVCGITDKTHPQMDFRYCPDCAGSVGYCTQHINQHEHKTAQPTGRR